MGIENILIESECGECGKTIPIDEENLICDGCRKEICHDCWGSLDASFVWCKNCQGGEQ